MSKGYSTRRRLIRDLVIWLPLRSLKAALARTQGGA